MKIVRGPRDILTDEMIVGVQPPLSPFPDSGWRRRSNFFTGRAVNELALIAEQEGRAGSIALLGQAFSHGVVYGLEAELARRPPAADEAPKERIGPEDVDVRVSVGAGIAISGEDVVLRRDLRLPYEKIPRLIGLGDQVTNAEVLVLRPVFAERTQGLDPTDPCEVDPTAYSYEDRITVDGAQLVRVPVALDVGSDFFPSTEWRNRYAYAAFTLERTRPAWSIPWLTAGVPVGLVLWSAEMQVDIVLDRFAVVRSGGRARAPRMIARKAGRSPLWQARVEQFVAHLSDVDLSQLKSDGLATHFRYLPPVAVVPPNSVMVRPPVTLGYGPAELPRGGLLPAQWQARALPIPVEALEDVYCKAASLAPLDTAAEEHVEILVPVPEQWFEPRLLVREVIDPAFAQAIYEDRLRLYKLVRSRGPAEQPEDPPDPESDASARYQDFLVHLTLTGKRRAYAIDKDPVSGEEKEPDKPPSASNGSSVSAKPDEPVEAVHEELRAELEALRADAERVLKASGAPIDLDAFIQSILGKSKESVVDPSLPFPRGFGEAGLSGFIEKFGERIERANDNLDVRFLRVNADVYRLKQYVGGNTAGAQLSASPALVQMARNVVAAPTPVWLASFAATVAKSVKEGAGGAAGEAPKVMMMASQPAAASSTFSVKARLPSQVLFAPATPLGSAVLRDRPLAGDLLGGILGTPDRSLEEAPPPAVTFKEPIAKRLNAPASQESYRYTLESKVHAMELLAAMHDELRLDMNGLVIPGFLSAKQVPIQSKIVAKPGKALSIEIEKKSISLKTVIEGVARGIADPVEGTDDASWFVSGTRALEDAVAILRVLEGRLSIYKQVLGRFIEARGRIEVIASKAEEQLRRIDEHIAEARQDVRVAELLRDEEEERLSKLNKRRDQIVAEHVPYLVLRRPRVFSERAELPELSLEPGNVIDPIPAALQSDFEAPEQLREMVDLFRDVPVGYLPHVRPLLDRLNRATALAETNRYAVSRAKVQEPALRASFQTTMMTTPLGVKITNVFSARQEVIRKDRAVIAGLDLNAAAPAIWSLARQQAERVVSIADLIGAKHGRLDVSREAADEIENIYRVAACLFVRFKEVPAIVRLRWTEQYSQFDAAADFQHLNRLSGWQTLPADDRREMQRLVDWLFQRIDAARPDAVAMMNDVVRVAMLLASHAPVNEIVEAEVAAHQTATVGGAIQVVVDPSRVRIGMQVALFGSQPGVVVARGVVHDLGAAAASVKVLSAIGPQVTPLRAQFSEPSAPASAIKGVGSVGIAGLVGAGRLR